VGWADRWMEMTFDHADPDVVLWSWCQSFVRRDLLPDRRVVVRFEFPRGGRRVRIWQLIQDREIELCRFDPGFGDDLVVRIEDPLAFARWHMGLVDWAAALRSGGIQVSGPPGAEPGAADLERRARDPRAAAHEAGDAGLSRPGYSQPLRRNPRYRTRQMAAITTSTSG
jgi:hypothetical protein